jgi:hypothetical protein
MTADSQIILHRNKKDKICESVAITYSKNKFNSHHKIGILSTQKLV